MYCWFSSNREYIYWYFTSKERFYSGNQNLEYIPRMEAKNSLVYKMQGRKINSVWRGALNSQLDPYQVTHHFQ